MAGIYIHIPFCASFCRYCSFYSERCTDSATMERYVDALLQEIAAADLLLQVQTSDLWAHPTLYIGGGTPSLLPPAQLERIVSAVRQKFLSTVSQNGDKNRQLCSPQDLFEEFTLEANPDDITPEKLTAWRRLGVNRLSIGVQSFCDAHLRWMCRRHTAAQAEGAVRLARKAGFDNISLDLIFGFAGLSDEVWLATIDRALALRPEHLSCYQMTVEEGSTLGDEAAAGAYAPPAQETCARQYALLQQRVAAAGYLQYEVSNFALPGSEAKHNSAYWRREPYWGFGPGAHSYDGLRTRRWNRSNLDTYLKNHLDHKYGDFAPKTTNEVAIADILDGKPTAIQPTAATDNILDFETLSDKDLANEKVMLSLRTASGLELDSLEPEHLAAIRPTLNRMLEDGRLVPTKKGLRIPADRLFVSDAIISDLFL